MAGLLTLSIGTGMQALTELADFRDLQTQASIAAVKDLTKNPEGRPTVLLPGGCCLSGRLSSPFPSRLPGGGRGAGRRLTGFAQC